MVLKREKKRKRKCLFPHLLLHLLIQAPPLGATLAGVAHCHWQLCICKQFSTCDCALAWLQCTPISGQPIGHALHIGRSWCSWCRHNIGAGWCKHNNQRVGQQLQLWFYLLQIKPQLRRHLDTFKVMHRRLWPLSVTSGQCNVFGIALSKQGWNETRKI